METRDLYLLSALAAGTVLISSSLVAGALKQASNDQSKLSDVGRWTVQNQYDGGWNVFDTQTGRVCSIPNGKIPGQTIICSNMPG